MKTLKIVVEKHPDGYVAYPLGLKGVFVSQGNTYDDALAGCKSAVRFHLKTFGAAAVEQDSTVLEAFIAECMPKFQMDAPKRKVVRTLQALGFRMVQEREHILIGSRDLRL